MTTSGIGDRVSLVTGAAGAFGRRIAVGLATSGAHVLAAGRPGASDGIDATIEACLRSAPSSSVEGLCFDVSDADAVDAAIDDARDRFRPIQLLVNNAGYQGVFAHVLDDPLADLRAVFEVNVVDSVPLGRFGSVDEVVDAVIFLLSDGAGFITGIDLEIAGGGR